MKRTLVLALCLWGILFPATTEAEIHFPFNGGIDFVQKKLSFTVKPDGKELTVTVVQENEKSYQTTVNIDHFSVPAFDIAAILNGTLDIRDPKGTRPRLILGKITSKYTLVNYKPIKDVNAQFQIKDGKLELNYFTIGNILCQGTVGLQAPYPLNLSIRLSGMAMDDFLALFTGNRDTDSSGNVEGKIDINGTLRAPYLKGKLFSYDGFVDRLHYSSIMLNLEGIYPILEIADSVITKDDGLPFNISGTFDISAKGSFKKQIEQLARNPVVSDTGKSLEWTFKRVPDDKSGKTEFKYLRRKSQDIHPMSEEKSDMLGVERTLEF